MTVLLVVCLVLFAAWAAVGGWPLLVAAVLVLGALARIGRRDAPDPEPFPVDDRGGIP